MSLKQATEREAGCRSANIHVSRLPFSSVPHQSRLFLEYLRDPISLIKYYPNVVESAADLGEYASEVLERFSTDRDALCGALLDINLAIEAGPATTANIERLRRSDTVAVLTGQQAGLFSGPLYTIYKALTAIKQAEALTAAGIPAVPVFWSATEDHDFDEVAEAYEVGRDRRLSKFEYRPADYVENSQVGLVEIDGEIDRLIAELFESLGQTEFSDDLRQLVSQCWKPSVGFGRAFMGMLARIFERYGLIFVDPINAAIKRLASPIFEAAVRQSDEIVTALTTRSGELVERGFHSQVTIESDYFPLFWIDDAGGRHALRNIGDGKYRVKGEKKEFAAGELETLARSQPESVSSGVMLRPVVQDFLFPTVCYFGGGAEVAYFAQNSEVYRILERPVTPVFHRQSFTVTEAVDRRIMEKIGISFPGLFAGREAVRLRLAEEIIAPETPKLFADVEAKINGELDRLDHAVSSVDPTLAANLAKRRRKIVYHIAALRKKTLLAYTRNDETFKRRLDALFASVLPNDGLQERTVNVLTLLNKYGPNVIEWIYDAIDLEDKEHRMIEL